MNILFVKLRHIGDTLILTPTLSAVRAAYPQARIDVLVRSGCEGILEGCPAIDNIFTTAAPESKNRKRSQALEQVKQLMQLRKVGYDFAFDMTSGDRSRLIIGLTGATKRVTNLFYSPIPFHLKPFIRDGIDFDFREMHQVEKDYQLVKPFLELPKEIPSLSYVKERTVDPEQYAHLKHFAIMHTATRWKRKEWPVERWVKVGRLLLERFEHLLISVGPNEYEVEFGEQISKALGERAIQSRGQLNLKELAGLLYRARFFVGVDTAVMHLAAACQVPMVTLFGPTNEKQWSPWKNNHAQVVLAERKESEVFRNGQYDPSEIDIKTIPLEAVLNACQNVLENIEF